MCLNTAVKTWTVEQATVPELSLLNGDFDYLAKLMWLVPKHEEPSYKLFSASFAGVETAVLAQPWHSYK